MKNATVDKSKVAFWKWNDNLTRSKLKLRETDRYNASVKLMKVLNQKLRDHTDDELFNDISEK